MNTVIQVIKEGFDKRDDVDDKTCNLCPFKFAEFGREGRHSETPIPRIKTRYCACCAFLFPELKGIGISPGKGHRCPCYFFPEETVLRILSESGIID